MSSYLVFEYGTPLVLVLMTGFNKMTPPARALLWRALNIVSSNKQKIVETAKSIGFEVQKCAICYPYQNTNLIRPAVTS